MSDVKEAEKPRKYVRKKVPVIPGLTLSNRELRERVKNRSIIVDDKGLVYTSDIKISQAARSSTIENARAYLKDVGSVIDLQEKISAKRFSHSLAKARQEGAQSAQKEASNG